MPETIVSPANSRQAAEDSVSGAASPEFSLAQARSIVGESFRPTPWVYWTDLLLELDSGDGRRSNWCKRPGLAGRCVGRASWSRRC